MKKRWIAALTALGLLLGLLIWATYFEPRRFVLNEYTITLPDWPVPLDGIRIVAISDLHVGSPHNDLRRLREIVRSVNAAAPDIVLLLGDFVIQGVLGGRFVEPEAIAAELAQIDARFGAFAVLGNHDWWFHGERVAGALEDADIPVLDDRSIAVDVRGQEVWLAGVSDFWEGAHDIEAALSDVPEHALVLLFTHNPDIFPDVPSRVNLTLAGHTHGGQVRLPWWGPPVVPSRFGRRYAAGHVMEDGRQLFVTTGTGMSILPVRFLVTPEIAVLELRGSASIGGTG